MAVRIGIIGTGGIAAAHLERLLTIPEAEVVAMCDLDERRIETTRDQVNEKVARIQGARLLDAFPYTDYRTMLRKERLDAAFVCLPPFARGEPEEAVIASGVNIFVEKPVTLDLALATRILEQINNNDVINAVGYQLRYLSTMDKAISLLNGRTIGMALVMRLGGVPPLPWYHVQNKSGGQLVEMATHHIDQLRFLIGEIKTVYAAGATRMNDKTNPGFDIFDVNCMTLTFENGVVANFANNVISGYGVPPMARGVHIFADGMTLSQSLGGPLDVLTKDGTKQIDEERDAMREQDKTFIDAVAKGNPGTIRSDYLNGIRTLAVTLAGEASARRQQPVDVMSFIKEEAPVLYELIENDDRLRESSA